MADKIQKIKEFLMGMAGAACCDVKTKKNIETNILPFIDSLQEEPASKVWYDVSEEPNINSMIIYKCNGCTPDIGRFIGVVGIEGHSSWEIFKYPQSIIINNIEKWAYVDKIINL